MESEKSTKKTKLRHISVEKRSRLKKSLSGALARARSISLVPSSLPSTILGHLQSQKKKDLEGVTPQKKTNKKKKILKHFTPKKMKKKEKILDGLTPQTKKIKKKGLSTLCENQDDPDGKITTLVRKQAFSKFPSLKRSGEVDNKRNSYRKVRFFWEDRSLKANKKDDLKGAEPVQIKNLLFLEPKSIVQHLWNMQMEQLGEFLPDWSAAKGRRGRKVFFTLNNLWHIPISFPPSGTQNVVLPQTTLMYLPTDSKTASSDESCLPEPRGASDEQEVFSTQQTFQNKNKNDQMLDISFESKEQPNASLPCFWGLKRIMFMMLLIK